MLDYGQSVVALAISQIASALFLKLSTGRTPPGLHRLILSLPVLLSNVVSPLLFSRDTDITTIVLVAFNTAWLSSFKTLLWALDRSALASYSLNTLQFAAILLTPLTPVSEGGGGGRKRGRLHEVASPRRLLIDGTLKLAFLGLIAHLLRQNSDRFPPPLRAFFYGLALYALLSSIMDGPAALLSEFFGVSVSPHFDQPWLSSSVASFWNRRWDLAAGNALRLLIYEPICEGKLIGSSSGNSNTVHHESSSSSSSPTTVLQPPSTISSPTKNIASPPPSRTNTVRRHFLGPAATFLTSGLVHEYIYWCLTGHFSGGKWLSFFLIQFPVCALERVVLRALQRRGILLPRPLLILWTLSFMCVVAAKLFFGPIEEEKLIEAVLSNVDTAYMGAFRTLEGALGLPLGMPADSVPVWMQQWHAAVGEFLNVKSD